MKKSVIIFVVFFNLFLVNLVYGMVLISEVELNPPGPDSGNEWIELYSDVETNITNWILTNNDGQNITLDGIINGYKIINLNTQWLDNSDEVITLLDGNNIIDTSLILEDGDNDELTWQYCIDSWNFTQNTIENQNNCTTKQNDVDPDPNPDDDLTPDEETFDIDWDEDDIINGDEFEIEVNGFNLKDRDYDVKLWITFRENSTKISQRYGENSDGDISWLSGNYYVYNFISGVGNSTEYMKIRISEEYRHFSGYVHLFLKVKNTFEQQKTIKIKKSEDEENLNLDDGENNEANEELMEEYSELLNKLKENSNGGINNNVIQMGKKTKNGETEDIKSVKNIVYQSKEDIIKRYAIYGFAFFCIILIILLAFEKLD